MKVEINKIEILEEMAVHSNHPLLDKSDKENSKVIQKGRDELAGNIKEIRKSRDEYTNKPKGVPRYKGEHTNKEYANAADNSARAVSQKGTLRASSDTNMTTNLPMKRKINIYKKAKRIETAAKK